MSNRKARRAAASAAMAIPDTDEEEIEEIPRAQPDRSGPRAKTLYDLAAERQEALLSEASRKGARLDHILDSPGVPPKIITTRVLPDGTVVQSSEGAESTTLSTVLQDLITPGEQSVVLAITLTMLHFTLDVLVHHQYLQTYQWAEILTRSATAFPILLILVYFVHPQAGLRSIQIGFLASSIVMGCYVIRASNRESYYATMKKAPPLGTLLVWMVMEMSLTMDLVCLGALVGYFWWGRYSIF